MSSSSRKHAYPALILVLLGLACGGGGGGGGGAGGGGIAPPGGTGPGPDLTVTDVTFTPNALTAGDTITTSDTVRNHGDQTATGFQIGVYLSTDAVITSTDVLLGFRTVGSLAAGATSTSGGSLTVPLATPAGTYFVGAMVDDLGVVSEPNEADNARAAVGTLAVTGAMLPELAVDSVTFSPLVVDAGDIVSVTDSVSNRGVARADVVLVGIYLSSDTTITSADVLLGFRTLATLDIGETSTVTGSLTVPLNMLSGLYYVGVVVDDGNAHVESNETNNTLAAPVRIQVNAPPRPDLAPSGVSFGPTTLDAGQLLSVSDVIINQGIADSGPFRVGVYLSTDATITVTDRLVAARTLPGLQSGLSSSVSGVPVVVPIDLPGGTYRVGVLVDDLGSVIEDSELNNSLVAIGTLDVTVPPTPDLLVTAVSFTPTAVHPALGEMLTITDTARNQGAVAAGAFRVGYYLSSNPVVSKNDVLLGSRTVIALSVGSSSSGSATVVLPIGLAAGSYFVGAIADDQDLVPEVIPSNNARTSTVALDVIVVASPMPQLKLENVQFDPKTTVAGGVFQVQEVVRNLGTQSASTFRVGIYLSTDNKIETSDVRIGERIVATLPIGFGSAASAPYTVPSGTTPGTYFVGAICDFADAVAESNEGDNAALAGGLLTVN
jgi:subtilase family serine protease